MGCLLNLIRVNFLDDIYRDIMLVGEPVLRNELLMLFGGYKSLKQ